MLTFVMIVNYIYSCMNLIDAYGCSILGRSYFMCTSWTLWLSSILILFSMKNLFTPGVKSHVDTVYILLGPYIWCLQG